MLRNANMAKPREVRTCADSERLGKPPSCRRPSSLSCRRDPTCSLLLGERRQPWREVSPDREGAARFPGRAVLWAGCAGCSRSASRPIFCAVRAPVPNFRTNMRTRGPICARAGWVLTRSVRRDGAAAALSDPPSACARAWWGLRARGELPILLWFTLVTTRASAMPGCVMP